MYSSIQKGKIAVNRLAEIFLDMFSFFWRCQSQLSFREKSKHYIDRNRLFFFFSLFSKYFAFEIYISFELMH